MSVEQRICYGCMNHIPADAAVCPICGFSEESYKPSPRSLPLHTLLHDRYEIGKVIGEGGFGITYIAWDTVKNQPTAIKEYFPTSVASRDCENGDREIHFFSSKDESTYKNGFDKYTREAKTLQRFEDLDGIVRILDFFNANNTAYIVMEYVDGITLKEYLETNGTLSPKETFELMTPVMLALEKIHREGVIHRDISPDNIMIRVDGAFKLIDFGAARLTNDESGKGLTIILKRGFAPEEQYRSRGRQGPWTDVYALCATMYKMMTNEIPPEAMDRLIEDDIKPIDSFPIPISPSQAHAIMKGLSVKAEDRFQTVTDLRLALSDTAEQPKELHMIATIQKWDGTITAYRFIDLNSNKMFEMNADQVIDSMSSGEMSVNNLIVYQRYIQPIGGSMKRYPVIDKDGRLLGNDNYYFVSHSASLGYMCLNYAGKRSYFTESQIKDLALKRKITNEDKLAQFISIRDRKTEELGPAKEAERNAEIYTVAKNVTRELREQEKTQTPVTRSRLSLATDHSGVGSSQSITSADAATQLRLKQQAKAPKPERHFWKELLNKQIF